MNSRDRYPTVITFVNGRPVIEDWDRPAHASVWFWICCTAFVAAWFATLGIIAWASSTGGAL